MLPQDRRRYCLRGFDVLAAGPAAPQVGHSMALAPRQLASTAHIRSIVIGSVFGEVHGDFLGATSVVVLSAVVLARPYIGRCYERAVLVKAVSIESLFSSLVVTRSLWFSF